MLRRVVALGAAAIVMVLAVPQNAAAQSSPAPSSPAPSGSGLVAKPVRIVVPGPPGGPAGAISLLIANKLGKYINQTVIVDNRPGAGGNIAIEHVARSAPDGFTLFFGVPALITNPFFQKAQLDPSVLAPVIQLNTGPFLLLVNGNSEHELGHRRGRENHEPRPATSAATRAQSRSRR